MTLSHTTKLLLAWHEVFRRIGFLSSELFVLGFADGVQLEARREGKSFTVVVAQSTLDSDEWAKAVDWWNGEMPPSEHAAVYKMVAEKLPATELIHALIAKGMYPIERSGSPQAPSIARN